MTNLTKAYVFFWDKGEEVPVDLYMALTSEGYDVDALQAKAIK